MKLKVLLFLFLNIGIVSCDNEHLESAPKVEVAKMLSMGVGESSYEISAPERKLTKNAYIRFRQNDLSNCKSYFDDLIKKCNGVVLNEYFNKSGNEYYKFETSIPSKSFDEAIKSLKDKFGSPENLDLKTEDFTKSYYDTESRLKSKRAFRDKCLELLSKAKQINDILSIEEKVSEVEDEIDELGKTMKNYDYQNDNYVLTVEFQTEDNLNPQPSVGFFTKLLDSFISGFSYASDLITYVISKWPLWIGLFLLYFVFKKIRNRRKKSS